MKHDVSESLYISTSGKASCAFILKDEVRAVICPEAQSHWKDGVLPQVGEVDQMGLRW